MTRKHQIEKEERSWISKPWRGWWNDVDFQGAFFKKKFIREDYSVGIQRIIFLMSWHLSIDFNMYKSRKRSRKKEKIQKDVNAIENWHSFWKIFSYSHVQKFREKWHFFTYFSYFFREGGGGGHFVEQRKTMDNKIWINTDHWNQIDVRVTSELIWI